MQYKLTISDFRIWVHLGCSDEEKYHQQMVSLNIQIAFASEPIGMNTDKIEDTICYAEIVNGIKAKCQGGRFNLIEFLTYAASQAILDTIGNKKEFVSSITITTHKLSPPVQDVHGGVSFTYSF